MLYLHQNLTSAPCLIVNHSCKSRPNLSVINVLSNPSNRQTYRETWKETNLLPTPLAEVFSFYTALNCRLS